MLERGGLYHHLRHSLPRLVIRARSSRFHLVDFELRYIVAIRHFDGGLSTTETPIGFRIHKKV